MTLTTCPKCGWDITHHLLLFNIKTREKELLQNIIEIMDKIPSLNDNCIKLKSLLSEMDTYIYTIEHKPKTTKQ